MRLDAYAEKFVEAGYSCLVFDYRHFGASDGKPRQIIEIPLQLADWASAISHARRIRPRSKIVLWGSSFAGGHVLAAGAKDGRIAAVISQCPHTSGPAAVGQLDLWTTLRLTGLAMRDIATKIVGGKPVLVEMTGVPGDLALMTGPGADERSHDLMRTAGAAKPPTKVAARIGLAIGTYSPGRNAKDLNCPVMFCLCTEDNVAPAAAARRFSRQAVLAEVHEYPVGHFDIYMDEPFEKVAVDQIEFLRKHLPLAN